MLVVLGISYFNIFLILRRLNIIDKGVLKIGKFYWLDDYFQNKNDYKEFSSLEISNSLKKIRKIILNKKNLPTLNKTINHFRLRDFFKDKIKHKLFLIISHKISFCFEFKVRYGRRLSSGDRKNEIKQNLSL